MTTPPTTTLPPRTPAEASPARLVATLAVAGAMTGALLVLVYELTRPVILAHEERALQAAVDEVLGGPERFETLWVVGDALVDRPLPGADADAPRVYVGFDAAGGRIGFAIPASGPGYQDVVRLIFGYDPTTGRLLGMQVLQSKETPGLGDKIEKDPAFVGQFDGALAPLVGFKAGTSAAGDASAIDMISGATISSRTVLRVINEALARLGPALAAHGGEASG